MNPVATATVLLVATALVGLLAIAHVRSRGTDGLNLRTWMLINFQVANVLSGFAHVLRWSNDRGYFEALSGSTTGADSGLMTAAWATFLGSCALWAGMVVPRPALRGPSRGKQPERRSRGSYIPENLYSFAAAHRVSVGGIALLLAAAGTLGMLRVMAATPEGGGRIIAVDGGNARYAFLAGWLPWAVSILVLALASRRRVAGPALWNTLLLTAGLAALAVSSTWNGGRAELMYVSFPLLALMLPRIRVLKWPILVIGAVSFAAFVVVTTAQRVGATTDPWSFIDWQWGRFSMAAWAGQHVDLHGSLGGETVWSALLNVPMALLHFAGAGGDSPFRSMVEVSGFDLLGDGEQIYIVPGFTAEMILNFGVPGVVVGYLIIGWLSALIADAYTRSRSESTRLLLASFGAVLVFQSIVGQLESFETFMTLSILPLWGLWLADKIIGNPRDRGQPLVLPGPADDARVPAEQRRASLS
ncbi:oligosaccharide repeat unit polymerase [Kocuria sp. cx-455]|uniref:O-antigen polymerase n=1 Tax=Kocuria sp. cx-455 TaxID=2771377 RepID=UPI001681CA03|nr:O-antigen polymerase [Kocuria sp. cx-455]MBD2766101.1 oligosaccharide repeat unit polymerase [Kocuria sp. cx-455]